jgi:hypothetical protein
MVLGYGVEDSVTNTYNLMEQIEQKVGGNWLAGFPDLAEPFVETGIPVGTVLLSDAMEGTLVRAGASVTLTFRFDLEQQAPDPTGFEFTLVTPTSGLQTFQATLAPNCEGERFLCAGEGCVLSDNNHCGNCDTSCTYPLTCISDTCQCDTELTLCNGACVDTERDRYHCGSCNHYCDLGCSMGSCITLPP